MCYDRPTSILWTILQGLSWLHCVKLGGFEEIMHLANDKVSQYTVTWASVACVEVVRGTESTMEMIVHA